VTKHAPTRRNLFIVVAAALFIAAAPAIARDQPESRLDAIVKQGFLRIGTTGDYKPFTYLNPETQQFEGIDIDMAKSLAKALGVEARFVQTAWPKLMADFEADKFDIAMGGVSVNLDRQKKGLFSAAYLVDGKTPIARCADKEKYQTLQQIDQPGVRVIVNPGGTNQRFAGANLKRAQVTVYDDNVTIFDQIVAGKADVMITDAIETVLQQKLRPALCAIHPEQPFNFSEKAYFLPRDPVFKAFVDQWLRQAVMSKEYQAIYDKWLK
jgi:cyclohexadienyl dehydratase